MAHQTIERPTARTVRAARRSAAAMPAAPRPVTARVAHLERERERQTYRRPLPASLLHLAQRAGHHPWMLPLMGAAAGVVAARLQSASVWPLLLTSSISLVVGISVVLAAWVVRRRMYSGVPLRPQEAVIDTDQAIPSAMFLPMACVVGWTFAILLI